MSGADAAVVPPAFDVSGPLPTGTTLLEASAGTGKTWTIAALVTRFVAEGVVRLEDMLVVTFGRAASQELRGRVRAQLVEAERALADPTSRPTDPPHEVLDLLVGVDADEREVRRRRVREALVDFDAATIATTHQFCQQVLRSLGVAGDTDQGARLVEDLDDLVVEVVDDLYVRVFGREQGTPPFDRATALEIAREASGDPQARLEPQDADPASPAGRRRRFAQAVRDELDLRRRRLGVLSYDDLLSQLAGALEPGDSLARARMQERWKVVLVDEFQDTDPVQWQVLDRAFSGVATMVLIGDPKQAIYAFRGGDVTTYLQAAATATTHATLPRSFRSDPALLKPLQAFLEGAALGDERIVVRPVEAGHTVDRLRGAPHPGAFRLRVVSREQLGARGSRLPAVAAVRDQVYPDLALDVRGLLASGATFDGHPIEPRHIAVLCETRAQCRRAFAALADVGVPAVVAGGGSVFGTPGAGEWLVLLEALEQPHRTDRVRAAALGCFLGRTATELDAGGERLTDELGDTVRDWAELARRRGVVAVFESALGTTGLLARTLAHVGGERLVTDLRHVAESLHDVAARDQLGLVALLGWLRAQMAQDKSSVASERTRRLDSDAAAVQIHTIHRSKGLEYPVVYLPSLADCHVMTPSAHRFHDDDGHRCLDVAGPGAPAAHIGRAAEEESGEKLRLLYVALTRAQSQVVTWWAPSGRNTQSSPLHRMLFGRTPGGPGVPTAPALRPDEEVQRILAAWQAEHGPVVEPCTWALGVAAPPAAPSPPLEARRATREADQHWRRTSYSSLSAGAEDHRRAIRPVTTTVTTTGPTTVTTPATTPAEAVLSVGSEPEAPPREDEDMPARATEQGAAGVPDDGTPLSPMAALPVGATFGSLVHAVLEHTDPGAPAHGGDLRAELLEHIAQQLVRWPVGLDEDELAEALVAVLDTPLGPLAPTTLREIGTAGRLCELDFELPLAGGDLARPASEGSRRTVRDLAGVLRRHLPEGDPLRPYADVLDDEAYDSQQLVGYLTGSLDLVVRVGGRYLVADYKSNWLGPQRDGDDRPLSVLDYRPEALTLAMQHSSYPLQALLYAVVLHRFLRWRLADYEPGRHLGGVLYLYVRGMAGAATPVVEGQPCGVFSWRPPTALVEAVSDLLDGAEAVA